MKKSIGVISMILMAVFLLLASCQKSKETPGPDPAQKESAQQPAASPTPTPGQSENPVPSVEQPEENIPLVTEVMSKEELQAYLKEKGIPIITKENFKEPELVWEKTYAERIKMVHNISDITDKGNCIVISNPPEAISEAQKTVLFLDNKGTVRKEIEFNNIKDKTTMKDKVVYELYPAMSGKYIGVYMKDKDQVRSTFTYYDEEGNYLWKKLITDEEPTDETPITVSYDGSVIAATLGNPRWNTEDEFPGNQNINKIMFFDSKGKKLSEYAGFRNVSIGKLSDNGEYYAAIIWWSGGIETGWNKLVYIRTKDGKVLWSRSFPGSNYPYVSDESYLSISERGTYVAAWEFDVTGRNENLKVHVYDRFGRPIAHAKHGDTVTENGILFSVGIVDMVDLTKKKILGINFNANNFLRWKGSDTSSYSFVSIDGTVLWEIPNEGLINFTKDGKYLKVLGYSKKEKLYKIKIFNFLISGGTQK